MLEYVTFLLEEGLDERSVGKHLFSILNLKCSKSWFMLGQVEKLWDAGFHS